MHRLVQSGAKFSVGPQVYGRGVGIIEAHHVARHRIARALLVGLPIRLAAPNVYSLMSTVASKISEDLVKVMVEGVTAYFTDMIVQDEALPNFIDAYSSLKKKAATIVAALGKDGFDVMATYNFKTGSVLEIGKLLGISEKQYAALKGTVVSEILKKVNALL